MCHQLNEKIDLPDYEDVLNADSSNVVEWNHILQIIVEQSDELFIEQKIDLKIGIEKIVDKLNLISTNHYHLIGPAGSGKLSFSKKVFMCVTYLGLTVAVT